MEWGGGSDDLGGPSVVCIYRRFLADDTLARRARTYDFSFSLQLFIYIYLANAFTIATSHPSRLTIFLFLRFPLCTSYLLCRKELIEYNLHVCSS